MKRLDKWPWQYESNPKAGGDSRKLVTLEQDGMVWVGIRIWHSTDEGWWNGNEPEPAKVLAWLDLPDPAAGRFVHGELL